MRLIKLGLFLEDYFEQGSRPSPAAVKRWSCAIKPGGEWFIDLDKLDDVATRQDELDKIMRDPTVAAALQ